MAYRTSPADLEGMPPGVPHIIGNEAAERFSFYGMKAVLAVFMAQYIHLMDSHVGMAMNEAEATARSHMFNMAVYFTPIFGALLADIWLGKYKTIILLSLVYCAGHATLACMGLLGNSQWWLLAGLGLIALGSGGIKPCVSAHVGDQFGARNSHLLPRIFNWFYFSINFGAFASMLLTPWLLEWYGPHWAFGVPGVLMAIATFIFWLGRHRFIHVPPGGMRFVREVFSLPGLAALLKLLPLYLFVAVFWALFDQTGSTWIFQSQDMDRHFLGFEWLPSQIQALNSLFIFIFIPLFAYGLYPLIGRVWRMTPLRKIGMGLFVTVAAFALVALVQHWIDGGARPNITWQIAAFILITAGEVMISIVALEFAYTQAPRTMKSLIMCYYLLAVFAGNLIVVEVNKRIQVPAAAAMQLKEAIRKLPEDWRKDPRNVVLPGYDGITGTSDDFVQHLTKGAPLSLEIPGQEIFAGAAAVVEKLARENGHRFPDDGTARKALASFRDPWGGPIHYQILNSRRVRLISAGPEKELHNPWNIGVILDLTVPEPSVGASWTDKLHPPETWLDGRKRALGVAPPAATAESGPTYSSTPFSGGQNRLEGTEYFMFFTWLALGAAVLYIPFALLYRPKTYLHE